MQIGGKENSQFIPGLRDQWGRLIVLQPSLWRCYLSSSVNANSHPKHGAASVVLSARTLHAKPHGGQAGNDVIHRLWCNIKIAWCMNMMGYVWGKHLLPLSFTSSKTNSECNRTRLSEVIFDVRYDYSIQSSCLAATQLHSKDIKAVWADPVLKSYLRSILHVSGVFSAIERHHTRAHKRTSLTLALLNRKTLY